MIDLHSHILPGIDDGAPTMEISVAMARMAFDDGIVAMACTPHIVPGLYRNTQQSIRQDVEVLRKLLEEHQVPLNLTFGADVHIAPDLAQTLKRTVPTVSGTRYFLYEPPHNILPPRIVEFTESIISRGFVPILTHPERLKWIKQHYDVICKLNDVGCIVQITAGSVTGNFGSDAQYYAERMMAEGRVDILATDAHNLDSRPPILSRARDWVAAKYGDEEALKQVWERPLAILKDIELKPRAGKEALGVFEEPVSDRGSLLGRFLKRGNWA